MQPIVQSMVCEIMPSVCEETLELKRHDYTGPSILVRFLN